MRTCTHPSPTAAPYLNDLYRFSAENNTWTALSPTGSGPTPRYGMGFTATPNGMLYVFGGLYSSGNEGKEGRAPLNSGRG
jgi:N-acetylneuraminic acid mutarotase